MKTVSTRRNILYLSGLVCLSTLFGCQAKESGPPRPPYGKAIDVTKANSVVEFDIQIEKKAKGNPRSRYDVVLEVFEKVPKETGPIPNLADAHFKVSIHSLNGDLIAAKEVIGDKEPDGMLLKSYFAPSQTRKTNLMSMHATLMGGVFLADGNYRIRCETVKPMPNLDGRLVKVIVENIHYPK
jgi:hypothetical protein